MFQPTKCFDCGNLIQCYALLKSHQTVPNSCGACVQKFKTMCQLLRHKCSENPEKNMSNNSIISSPAPSEKRIRIKSEPGLIPQAPVVFLKNVNDTNIPAILDDEPPTQPTGSKKKSSK